STHTYLDGTGPFTSLGLWAVGSLHSTATLSTQSGPAACMCLRACAVSINRSLTKWPLGCTITPCRFISFVLSSGLLSRTLLPTSCSICDPVFLHWLTSNIQLMAQR
ncbi:hypothetical protein K438DRAFT_2097137, partial [Mycena galopus ATCC 62051]